MKSIIYKSDAEGVTAIGNSNPLPVTFVGYDSDTSFSLSEHKENATGGNLVKAGISGKSIYITDLMISAQQAGQIWFYDGAGTTVIDRIFLAANGLFEKSWTTPIKVASGQSLYVKSNAQIHFTLQMSGYVA
jgi:hypothetical protein